MPKSNSQRAGRRKRNPKAAGKPGEAASINTTEEFERELIERAQGDDAEAGREILYSIALAIDARRFDSPLFPFLADCLMEFAQDGKPLEQALCVEQRNWGGRPIKYNETELAAVDILLRDYAGRGLEAAIEWIDTNIGTDRRTVQKIRGKYDSRYNEFTDGPLMESFSRDDLLHCSGSLRSKVAEVLSK